MTGGRIDRWLAGQLQGLSRSRIQLLIKSGDITVGGVAIGQRMKPEAGMVVDIRIPDLTAQSAEPEAIPLDILYEDKDIVVVNKRPGMVVHPAIGNPSGTLVNALLHHCRKLPGINGVLRPGIVHRLDKNTSGAIVAAKTEKAMIHLGKQFSGRKVEKEYLAIVRGGPRPRSGRIETLIGRSAGNRKKMSANPISGRTAITVYETLRTFGGMSLLKVKLETGRTHQIRVHLAHIGHSVVGDADYGRQKKIELPVKAGRQMLHAARLAFSHPSTGKRVEFVAPVPDDMQKLIDAMERTRKKGG